MTVLKQIKANLRTLDINSIIRSIVSQQEVKDFIIDLNTNKQLFGEGENSLGIRLEEVRGKDYSPFTIQEKIQDGLPFDRVTLFQTGDFYSTFVVVVNANSLSIEANPLKDDTNLFTEWGEDIVGLQDENLQLVIDLLRDSITELFINEIVKNI
ncbi:MAG: hypothetical protein KUG81_09840 [Gammaproteobacteria bacterium]|nr:hypothetical protein [Gammaproteobacteria bacterium]